MSADAAARGRPAQWIVAQRDWVLYRNETSLGFPEGAAQPTVVAKRGQGAWARASLRREWENLRALGAGADPVLRRSLPEVLGFQENGESALLIQSALSGRPLTTLLHRLRRERRFFRKTIRGLVEWLLRLHRMTGVRTAEAPELAARFGALLDRFHARLEASPRARSWLARVEAVLADPSVGPVPLVRAHGDLCPANVLVDGGEVRVIDWECVVEEELPLADLLQFFHGYCHETSRSQEVYLTRLGETLFGAGPAARALREAVARYRREVPVPEALVRVLPTLLWVESAVLQAEYQDEARGGRPGYCSHVVVADRRCLNLERFAGREWPG